MAGDEGSRSLARRARSLVTFEHTKPTVLESTCPQSFPSRTTHQRGTRLSRFQSPSTLGAESWGWTSSRHPADGTFAVLAMNVRTRIARERGSEQQSHELHQLMQ